MVMHFLSFLLEEWTSMTLCSPSSLHLFQQHSVLHHGLTAFTRWTLGQSRKRIFFCFQMNQLKVQMLIPIRNYLNNVSCSLCFSGIKTPKALVPHMLQTSVMRLYLSIFQLMFQNRRTPWASRAFKHRANSDGKHVVLLLNNVSGHNKWHLHINLHQSMLIRPQHIATSFAPGQTARLRWMRAAQVLQDVFVSSICRMGRSVFIFDSKASYNHGYEAAVWV